MSLILNNFQGNLLRFRAVLVPGVAGEVHSSGVNRRRSFWAAPLVELIFVYSLILSSLDKFRCNFMYLILCALVFFPLTGSG